MKKSLYGQRSSRCADGGHTFNHSVTHLSDATGTEDDLRCPPLERPCLPPKAFAAAIISSCSKSLLRRSVKRL